MVKKIKVKRVLVISVIFICMVMTLGAGIVFLIAEGKDTVNKMSYRTYLKFADETENAVGAIYDTNGDILWSRDHIGYEDTYSLVGDLHTVLATNNIAIRQQETLWNPSSYNIYQGYSSLSDSGKDIYITIDHDFNEAIYVYMKLAGIEDGSALFMDASTGDIKAAVSIPSCSPGTPVSDMVNGTLLNKNFLTTIPGSTMKVVTSVLLLEQDPDVLERTYACTGSHTLSDGSVITCITKQSSAHDMVSALGVSCNAYYAQAITNVLDPNADEVVKRLEELGIYGAQPEIEKLELVDGSGILYEASKAGYNHDNIFESTWALIGEGNVQVSPLDMCRIVSAIVKNGNGATPHLLKKICNTGDGIVQSEYEASKETLIEAETADKLYGYWKQAYDTYYSKKLFNDKITVAKTGTAEYENMLHSARLLTGYIEDKNLVFFIEIKNYDGDIRPVDVVNFAANYE